MVQRGRGAARGTGLPQGLPQGPKSRSHGGSQCSQDESPADGKELGSPGGTGHTNQTLAGAGLGPPAQHRPPHTHTLSPQQAKFTYYRCAELLGWQLRHTLFCSLAWARGLSARHFLWACLVRGLGQGTPGCSWEGEVGAGPWPPQGPPPGPSV